MHPRRLGMRLLAGLGLLFVFAACGAANGGGDAAAPGDESAGDPDTATPPDAVLDAAPDPGAQGDTPPAPDTAAEAGVDLPAADAPDATPGCAPGSPDRCSADGAAFDRCVAGVWQRTACPATMTCLGGQCVPAVACTPGAVGGCQGGDRQAVCDASGRGFVGVPCAAGEFCFDEACRPAQCLPGTSVCLTDAEFAVCRADGQGYGPATACEPGFACTGTQCTSGCAVDPKFHDSYVGCVFWSLDLGQWHVLPGELDLDPDAAHIPHAVVVGNPGRLPAYIRFETGTGEPVDVGADPYVQPGHTRSFIMPVMSLQVTAITPQSIRLTSTQPVTAAQFNPPSNADFVHTSDASMLLPEAVLGTEHIVVSGPSVEPPNFGMRTSTVYGYFTVLAVRPGETTVQFAPTVATQPGPDLASMPAGALQSFVLQQWDVLNVDALAAGMMDPPSDLTGTIVTADQPVAVFGGHDCLNVGEGNCDHCESQLFPVAAWGTHYVAGRLDTASPNLYRIVSADDNNALMTNPSISGIDQRVLARGQWLEASVGESFEITGSGRLEVVQFIAGNEGGAIAVDPSMAVVVPVAQFRDDYPILVPSDYAENRVNIVRPAGASIEIDGNPVAASAFRPVGSGTYEVANVAVNEGVVRITGTAPFGLTAYGYDQKVSYAYPAGFDAAVLVSGGR